MIYLVFFGFGYLCGVISLAIWACRRAAENENVSKEE